MISRFTTVSCLIIGILFAVKTGMYAQSQTTIQVKAYLQGYLQNAGVHTKSPIAIELTTGATLSSSVSTTIGTCMISTTGIATVTFANLNSGNYWIIVRHGGHLPVGSATLQAITAGITFNYDFTTAANTAFNSILILLPGTPLGNVYGLRAGDLNGDRTINAGGDGIIFGNNLGLGIRPSGVPDVK